MSLATKNQRGSAINVGMPWRQWLAEPDGVLDLGDRFSILKYVAGVASVSEVAGWIDYRVSDCRLHFRADSSKLHFHINKGLLHYRAVESMG